jgi:hypothetical protein
MSPEQVRGAPIDGRSDIFCLGTILYEITLGRCLWRGPREVAVKRIVEERPKPPTFVRRDYPADLELIVLRTLEKKAEDRYQSATELHEDLQNFLASSSAHLRNNFQMADYVAKIFSEEADALISDSGRRRAQAFVEGGDSAEADQADLDFDVQQSEGPGAALARTLRASALGVWANESEGPADVAKPAHSAGSTDREPESLFSESASDLKAAAEADTLHHEEAAQESASPEAEPATKVVAKAETNRPRDEAADHVPRRWNGIVVAGIVLAVALGVGLLWWLRGS